MSASDRKDKSINLEGVDITSAPAEEFDSPVLEHDTGSLQFGDDTQESSWIRKALSTGIHKIKEITGKIAIVELGDPGPEDPFSDMPRKIKVNKTKGGGAGAVDYQPKWKEPQQGERSRFEEGGDAGGEYTRFNSTIGEYMTTEKKRTNLQKRRSMRQQRAKQRQSALRFLIRIVLIGAMIVGGIAAVNYLSQWQQTSESPVAKIIKKKQKNKKKINEKDGARKRGSRSNSRGSATD